MKHVLEPRGAFVYKILAALWLRYDAAAQERERVRHPAPQNRFEALTQEERLVVQRGLLRLVVSTKDRLEAVGPGAELAKQTLATCNKLLEEINVYG